MADNDMMVCWVTPSSRCTATICRCILFNWFKKLNKYLLASCHNQLYVRIKVAVEVFSTVYIKMAYLKFA